MVQFSKMDQYFFDQYFSHFENGPIFFWPIFLKSWKRTNIFGPIQGYWSKITSSKRTKISFWLISYGPKNCMLLLRPELSNFVFHCYQRRFSLSKYTRSLTLQSLSLFLADLTICLVLSKPLHWVSFKRGERVWNSGCENLKSSWEDFLILKYTMKFTRAWMGFV